MDEKNVPYIVYEGSISRMERITKRLVIALVIAVLLIFASNASWLYFWNQYDVVEESKYVDINSKDCIANYIGNNGDIVNGKDYSDNQAQDNAEEER